MMTALRIWLDLNAALVVIGCLCAAYAPRRDRGGFR